MKITKAIIFILLLSVMFYACNKDDSVNYEKKIGTPSLAFSLQSNTISSGGVIPNTHRSAGCVGQNRSPQLSWSHVPRGTKSLAIIMNDTFNQDGLNATTYPHWAVWNIPIATTSLPENQGAAAIGGAGAGLKQMQYRGACPPPGLAHTYTFTIYALSTTLAPTKAGGAALSFDNVQGGGAAVNVTDYAGVRAAIAGATTTNVPIVVEANYGR